MEFAFHSFDGLTASLIAGSVSAAGILAMSIFGNWAARYGAYFSAFAVGLISVSVLFHLIPEAASISPLSLGWVAAGFAAMVLIGILVQTAVNQAPNGAALSFGYASIIALAAHSFLDGAIYASAFHDEDFTGWIATSGLIFHEFPEGVIAFTLLRGAGIGNLRSTVLALIAASLTTIGGTISADILFNTASSVPIAAMLGVAAGALIYVLIVHLGPQAATAPDRRGYDAAMFGVGVGTIAIVLEALNHTH